MDIRRFTPSADRKVLVLLAGAVWFCVGAFLISLAVSWLSAWPGRSAGYYAAGFALAMLVHHFGFLRVADKNLRRLLPLDGPRCVFSFISWKSYILVGVMIAMGAALRHSSFPKQYLSVLYNGIGLALLLSSVRYFRHFIGLLREPRR